MFHIYNIRNKVGGASESKAPLEMPGMCQRRRSHRNLAGPITTVEPLEPGVQILAYTARTVIKIVEGVAILELAQSFIYILLTIGLRLDFTSSNKSY